MANPVRTWTIAVNQTLSSSTVQLTQFRELCFAYKTLLVAAGYTITRSSNGDAGAAAPGGGAAGAGDNWTSAAALGVDVTASGGAWFVAQAPSSLLQAGEAVHVIGVINDADAVNPQIFQLRMSPQPYTGGTTTALPTTAGVETATSIGVNILSTSSTAVPTRYMTWRSSRGDTMFAVKREGVNALDFFAWIGSSSDSDGGGQGGYRLWLIETSGVGSLLQLNGINSSTCRGFNSTATVAVTLDFTSILTAISTSSLDYNNEIVPSPGHIFDDSATGFRWFGATIDFWTGPASGNVTAIWGRLIDEETPQVQRRYAMGQVYLYVPSASLPLV